MRNAPATFVALVASCSIALVARGEWKPAAAPLTTPWAASVRPDNVFPEYPRPLMTRPDWLNLNGMWDTAITAKDAPAPASFSGQILVPFPVESALSGVQKPLEPDQRLWYRRTVTPPEEWKGRRLLLHFGAVDWETEVFVNGRSVGRHTGGYDPFSFDISEAAQPGTPIEIVVAVADPTDAGGQPRGKQVRQPHGIYYTRISGIWQTVWMEPVAPLSIESYRLIPNLAAGEIKVSARVRGQAASPRLRVEAMIDGTVVASGDGALDGLTLKLAQPRAWSPSDPFLYNLRLTLLENETAVDVVGGQFGMRDVALGKDDAGRMRILLNGKPLFQFGPLDQGFWPDGLYTPPCEKALRFDIEAVKRMGGNMLRKHVKVEPQRFYHLCDQLGVLVWQDMPSGDNPAEARATFESELSRMIDALENHPSIIMWVPFNEGWGQYDTERVTEWVRRRDPSRLVNNASGWTDHGVGDVLDIHAYPGPSLPPLSERRAAVLGEFGGLGLPVEGHTWAPKDNWGYVSYKSPAELTNAYVGLIDKLAPLVSLGLSAAVYTQTSDVEIEVNGWLTYDRTTWKIEPKAVAAATARLYEQGPALVLAPTALQGEVTWRYTLQTPPEQWTAVEFDDTGWESGAGGFGEPKTPGAIVKTPWNTPDIWLRREFKTDMTDFKQLAWLIHHDEDAEVYLNGQRVLALKEYTTGYTVLPFAAEHRALLRKGANRLAVHCHQTKGGQYIDVGLVDLGRPAEKITDYDVRRSRGFELRIRRGFQAREPVLLDRVLLQLEADLDEVESFTPPAALALLRESAIWLELEGTMATANQGHGMCCHWSPAWLAEHGLVAEKVGGVEIINPRDYLTWRRDQPYMLFHELAHALHWRLPGLDARIREAYESARAKGLYERVDRNTVPAPDQTLAYAATNSHEYFAELSEAYFALNDFYPYTRRQLQAYDPDGARLIGEVWNLGAGDLAAACGPRE